MGMIKVSGLSKSFGIDTVFEQVSFTIRPGECIGLVGRNGAGKSTLLRCLIGQMEADSGSVVLTDQATLGYVRQEMAFAGRTLREEMEEAWQDVLRLRAELTFLHEQMRTAGEDETLLERYARLQERFEWLGGYEYEAMTRRILHGLGFIEADWDRPANDFSGGQKTRINLARALVRRPDFLVLDEPTNHLDIEMVEWLEGYLRSYRGGILLVSHDRYFLDAICTGIFHLENTRLRTYRGNYSKFMREKSMQDESDRRAYEKQQEMIAETEEYIRRYKAGIKSKQARGRQSQLNRLERLEKPIKEVALRFHFKKATGTADKVIVAEDLAASYGDRMIFSDINMLIRQGESVGLIGPNGVGKSTLLSLLIGKKEPSSGRITIGNRVRIGYYSQEHDNLHPERTVLAEVMYEYGCGESEARDILGGFLFRGDDVLREVGQLSGGEKARLALLLLFLEAPNVIILDEPTNHLDIPTREVIEDALAEFGGTYLVVSHDRYFLDRIVTRTLSFEDGILRDYPGNYSYWKEKRKELVETGMIETAGTVSQKAKPTLKEREKCVVTQTASVPSSRRTARTEADIAQIEQEIARMEATLKMYTQQMTAAAHDPELLATLVAEMEAVQVKLERGYEKWEALMAE